MSLDKVTLTYIEGFAAALGAVAATMVASAVPQPYFGMAFWLYVISATLGVIVMYNKKCFSLMLLFIYYIGIDSYGIYNWWPF